MHRVNLQMKVSIIDKMLLETEKEIDEYCKTNNIKYINYFYHEELVKNKKENNT